MAETHANILQLDDATFFSTIKSEGLMLTDFWAAWCGPCRQMAPIIEELASQYDGRMKFAKLNVDANPVTAQQFGIMSIPTFLITDKGKVVDVIIGAMPKLEFVKEIEKYAGKS
ncbi:MAG: thioredoxin [Bacteroidetes bacterium]|nr:thioredoxin [Bacteroidota bacterium]